MLLEPRLICLQCLVEHELEGGHGLKHPYLPASRYDIGETE